MPKKIYKNRDEIRKNTVAVPVNAKEKAKIKAKAEQMGLTVSSYCRHVLIYDHELGTDDERNTI